MFLKKLVGRTDIENALQRLENIALVTSVEALKAIHGIGNNVGDKIPGVQDALQAVQDKVQGVEGMLQGVTDKLQGVDDRVQSVDDRVKDIGDKVINGAQTVQLAMSTALIIWLGVEKTERQTDDDFDTISVEGLEGVCDGALDVDEVRSTVEDIGSRAIASDGAQVFSN